MTPEDFLLMTEAQIMGYGESDSSGCWIKLQITEEDLAKIRGKKGIACEFTLREQDPMTGDMPDSGQSDQPKGGRYCRDAVLMCKHPNFQRYVASIIDPSSPAASEEQAKIYLTKTCGVESRAEIDSNAAALTKFKSLCRDYAHWAGSKA